MEREYKLGLLIALTFFTFFQLLAQVPNDSMKNRIRVELNGPLVHSLTDHCTVESTCVNQLELKRKITFHNDQWYSFFPRDTNSVYLNIVNQKCRDQRGLQVLVFDGIECEPQTYSYTNIQSLLTTDNYSYRITGLKKDKEYFIQVDGLLGDFCSFYLNITASPPDYVIDREVKGVFPTIEVINNLVKIELELNSTFNDSIKSLQLHRKDANKLKVVKNLSSGNDTRDFQNKRLSWVDTIEFLTTNDYYLVGKDSGGNQVLLDKFQATNQTVQRDQKNIFGFTSNFKGKDILLFSIFYNDRMLFRKELKNSFNKQYLLELSKFFNVCNCNELEIIVSYEKKKQYYQLQRR